MADDNEEDEQAMCPFIFSIPEQMMEQMRIQQDKTVMAGEVWRHEVRSFMEGLTAEQAITFKSILRNFCDNPSGAEALANFWEGMISFMIDAKFGLCTACGKNHDDDITAMSQETVAPDPDIDQPEVSG